MPFDEKIASAGLGPKILNLLFVVALLGSGGALFVLDVSQPRGVVDGVGYAALVALASRCGPRALIGAAAVTTVLTLIGAALVPDAGISVAGMWGNRACAIAAIWVVALVMKSRIDLLEMIQSRETNLRRHELALSAMVRHCLLEDVNFDEKLTQLCQLAAEALGGIGVMIGLRDRSDGYVTVLRSWRKSPDAPFRLPGSLVREDRVHKARLMAEFVVTIDDIEESELELHTRQAVRAYGARSTIAAEIFHTGSNSGTIWIGREGVHHWSEEEIAFARAVASLAGLMISARQNSETLAALDLTDEGLYTEDAGGHVLYANRAARRFARQGDEQARFPRPDVPLEAESDHHEIRVAERELEIWRSRLPSGGLIARLEDVTVRNRAYAERAALETRLQQAAKMEAIGQLAGGIAHDFNNILGAIMGFAGFIAQDSAADVQNRDFAQRILSASRRGKEMVQQIMAFAETRAVSHGVTNLSRIVENERQFLAGMMHPGAMLEVDIPDEPVLVRGNAVQIGQLIANLVSNGRDALDGAPGSIDVAVSLPSAHELSLVASGENQRVIGSLQPDRRYACLQVHDSGQGIAPQTLNRIFEPFFSTKGRQRGSGLGLAVVHGVVRSHAGACHVRTDPGRGTSFSVYLPLIEDHVLMQPGVEAVVRPCRVLIVDDEADIADMISIGLERLGFQTVAVQNPLTALAALEEEPGAFDALLTDQIMPAMRGMELIREARRLAPGLRTVLCTGHAEDLREEDALLGGADAVLHKPVEIQAIAEALSADTNVD